MGREGPLTGQITVPAFDDGCDGVLHFFGTRHQAVEPEPGTAKVWHYQGDSFPRTCTVVSVKQVHGTESLILDRPVRAGTPFAGGWDALVTNQPDTLLTIRTADCVPVLLHDPHRKVVAAIHAGWRGAVAGIVPRTLSVMQQRFRSEPAGVRVVVGPSIGPCCYEVDEPVLRRVRRYQYWRSVIRPAGSGKGYLDLRELIQCQALEAGVEQDAVWRVNLCTACHPKLFYSYRREGKVTRTMVSGIMLKRH